jgi:hypothetical protein
MVLWSIRILYTLIWGELLETQESSCLIAHLNIKKVRAKPVWKWAKKMIWLMPYSKKLTKLLKPAILLLSGSPILLLQRKEFQIWPLTSSSKKIFQWLEELEKLIITELLVCQVPPFAIELKKFRNLTLVHNVDCSTSEKSETNTSVTLLNQKTQKPVALS